MANVVPRKMLDLCRDTLKRCLASRIELQRDLDRAHAEVSRLERIVRRLHDREK